MKLERYTRNLKDRGSLVFIGTAIVILLSILGIVQLKINTSFDVFTPPNSARSQAIAEMNKSFGDASQLLVLADVGYDDSRISGLKNVGVALLGIDGVHGIDSPALNGLSEDGTMSRATGSFLAPFIEMSNEGGFVERDGSRYAMFRLRLAESVDAKAVVRGVRDAFDAAGITILLSGEPYLQAEIFTYILKIIITIPPLAIVLMLLVFRIRIGSIRATMLSMVPAIVGAVVTLGGVSWIRGSISSVSVLVPIFVIVLGSADGLHITSHVIDGLRSGKTNLAAVTETLRSVGSAIILTTITTMAGFLSLLLMNSNAIRELGITAAIGMLVAGVATWLILPAILLHQRPLDIKKSRKPGHLIRTLFRLRGIVGVAIPIVLVAAFLPGAMKVRKNFSMIDMYRPHTEVRKAVEAAADLLGGSIPVYVLSDSAAPEQAFDAELAEAFLELHRRVEEEEIAGRSISAYAIIADAYGRLTGKLVYPPTPIAKRMASAVNSLNPDTLGSFVADDGTVRAAFFLRDLDRVTLERFIAITEDVSQTTHINLSPVGSAFAIKDMNDQITRQQFRSLVLAVLLVFILTAVTQRSVLLGAASALPVAVTLVVMFGVMSYAHIDLSIVTGIMSGLTIGVGIDYSVHFISLYRRQRLQGVADPTRSALNYVATPILANALGLAIGFTAMFLSPLSIHVTLSILMWVTMIVSAVLSLTLLPTITARLQSFAGKGR